MYLCKNNVLTLTTNPAEKGRWESGGDQGWAKLVLIALERYSVELKRLTFNFR
jgi:hypothetical protein